MRTMLVKLGSVSGQAKKFLDVGFPLKMFKGIVFVDGSTLHWCNVILGILFYLN
ncbi:hypothetical protein HanPSC8_Chr12g0511471 [Helianthus annuus]|nr:hypothetical protein HanPSC8_Chr12g0511471 [Helianthus annuus]